MNAYLSIAAGAVLYALSIAFLLEEIEHYVGRGGYGPASDIFAVGLLVGLIGAAGLTLIVHGVVSRLKS